MRALFYIASIVLTIISSGNGAGETTSFTKNQYSGGEITATTTVIEAITTVIEDPQMTSVGCPTVASTTCTACSDNSTCTTIAACDINKFDTNNNATDGCEAGCAAMTGGTCTTCGTAIASGCTAVACNANRFDTNGIVVDGCEVGCAAVTNGTCTACDSATASGCTSVMCAINKFDTNNDATDGCEAGCGAVNFGTCTACGSAIADGCTAVTCDINKFDTNNNATDGCEAGCAAMTGGTCTTCGTAIASGCTAVACNANRFDTNGIVVDGCEVGCAAVTNGTCTSCDTAVASGCTAVTCDINKFDTNNNATDGCEAGCAAMTGGTCTTCGTAIASGCTAVACNANRFDTNGIVVDGCEVGCAAVTNGTCTACDSATASGCTSVMCAINKFDTNNDATDGCEAGCGAVNFGTCTACGSAIADGCTAVTCDINKFDTNNNATDGCEAGCAAMSGGTCTTCDTAIASGCTAVACNANRFDTNGIVVDGCEVGCAAVTNGTCKACNSAVADGCTAVTCEANKFDTNENAADGCEAGCAAVTDGTCTACNSAVADGCTAVTCEANKFNNDGNLTNGCEVGCPVVTDGTCDTCDDATTCTAVTCSANKFDTDDDATNGCEAGCPTLASGICSQCSDATTCTQCGDSSLYVVDDNPIDSLAFCSRYDQNSDDASRGVYRYPDCDVGSNEWLDNNKCQCWTKYGNTLYSSLSSESISICDPNHKYCNVDFGHCLTHDYCIHMNGQEKNTVKCLCELPITTNIFDTESGYRTLDQTTKQTEPTTCSSDQYCLANLGECSLNSIDECYYTHGNIKNNFDDQQYCACGNIGVCNSTNPFCSSSNSVCTANVGNSCPFTDGESLNKDPCSCGSTTIDNCKADNFCTVTEADGIGVCNNAYVCPTDKRSLCEDIIIKDDDGTDRYFNGFKAGSGECATPGCDTAADIQQCCKPCSDSDWDLERGSCSKTCPSTFVCPLTYILPPSTYRFDSTNPNKYSRREVELFDNGFTGFCRAANDICEPTPANIQTCCLKADTCHAQDDFLCNTAQGYYKPLSGWDSTKVCQGVLCRPSECCDFATCLCSNGIAHLPPTCDNGQTDDLCKSCDNSFFLNETVCQRGTACGGDQYMIKEANTNSDTMCGSLTVCSNDEYIQTVHTPLSDRVCATVSTCSHTQYELTPSSLTSDRECQDITQPCDPTTQWQSQEPNETQDRICSQLTEACSHTQYESKSPSHTSDRECQDLTQPCDNTQWQSQEPNETQDRICLKLTDACNNDSQYESQAPTETQDRNCQDRIRCDPATQYEFFGGTSTSDRICSDLTVCSRYEYISTPKTNVRDRTCSVLTTCNSSQYAKTDPKLSAESGKTDMYTSDRVCSVCQGHTTCLGCMDPSDCHYDKRALVHSMDLCSGKEESMFYTYISTGSNTVFKNKEGQTISNVVLKNNVCVRFEPQGGFEPQGAVQGTSSGMFYLTDTSTLRQINNDDGTLYYTSFQVPTQVDDFKVLYNNIPFDLQQNCVKETVLNTTVCVVTNKTCVDGIMKGTRAIWWKKLVSADHGGEDCTTNPYYEECDNDQCDVDCQEECNDTWSECLNPQGNAVQCGENGTNTKQCTVHVESKHAGTKCTPVQTKNCTGSPSENDCDCRGNVLDGCGVCGGTCCPPGEYRDRCGICGGTNQCDSLLKLRASLKHDRSKVMRMFLPVAVFVLLIVAFVGFFFCLCNREKAVEVTNKKTKTTLIF